ncbi:MAG TPA: YaeQ family protein [Kofleriaceae bacterium]|jgi:uncharacterized protein YaeQ|nr:YaeQ family protein [Kofleriaceae bacterium]
MALGATMRRFEIELADSDRDRYETIELRAAQHPSESDRYLAARVIARVMEHAEGVEFSAGGVSSGDEPAILQRDLRGDLRAWIEVGSPSPERLHRASKLGARVAIYGWRGDALAREIADTRVHRAEALELFDLAPDFLDAIAATLDRANAWALSIADGALYMTCNGVALEGAIRRVRLP